MARVMLLGTGGTIASRALDSGGVGATEASGTLLTGADLADLRRSGVEVEATDVLSVNSFNLTFAQLREISDAVRTTFTRDDVDGIVLTHGTDTMEETAALLAWTLGDERPVVLTGAQRNADDPESDGRTNLLEAIAVAAAPESRGRGVLTSFAGEVLAPVGLRKAHTTRAQPFVNTMETASATSSPWPLLAAPEPAFDRMRIDALLTYPGGDARLFEAAVEAGAQGVVLVSTGTGNPGSALVPAIETATRRGVLVGISSRTGSGSVEAIYGNGGAVDAVAAGAVLLGEIPASQARVLLALLLAESDAAESAQRLRQFIRHT